MSLNAKKNRHTAALLLGAALSDMVPQGFLLTSGGRENGFYTDWVLGEDFPYPLLPHIEGRVHELIAKNDSIKIHEMVPSNAYEFLKHHKRYYPAHFARQSDAPLVQVVQMGPYADLAQGEYHTEAGQLPLPQINRIEERPPLVYRKEKKKVFRIYGQWGSERSIDPYALGKKLSLFDAQVTRENYLEKVELRWRKNGESLLFAIYQKWRELHLIRGFELVSGPLLEEGKSAQFFIDKKGHHDRCRVHCKEEELETVKGECQKTAQALALIPLKDSFLSVKKKGGFYTMDYSIFSPVEEMILEVLGDNEKDLSQKKELLGIVAVCDE